MKAHREEEISRVPGLSSGEGMRGRDDVVSLIKALGIGSGWRILPLLLTFRNNLLDVALWAWHGQPPPLSNAPTCGQGESRSHDLVRRVSGIRHGGSLSRDTSDGRRY